jgi:peptidoglycan/LPS O-acetylase OafA/YrhL
MLDVEGRPRAGTDRAVARESHVPALDGVRAVAVLGVIASHSGLFNLGWLGVDIFFGLSGYLITGILLDAKAAGPSAREYFVPFYMRRALRILPLAWAAAVVMAFIQNEWSGLLWYVGYLVNWLPQSPPPSELGHYWSLAVEEQFYLLWPALVFFTSRRTLWNVSIAVIAVDVICRFCFSMWPPAFANAQFLGLATFARADTLAVGAMLAQRQRSGGWGRERSWAVPAALLAAVMVVAIRWMELKGLFPLLTYNLKWPVIALGVGGGLLFVLTRPPRILQWPFVAWIGQISYGIYVIHAFFGRPLHRLFSFAPTIFLMQVALTIPIAAASWYLFESPILKQKWRWPMPTRKLRPQGTTR